MALLSRSSEYFAAAHGQWPASGAWFEQDPRWQVGGHSRPRRPRAIRVFENAFLENVLASAHPLTPIVWFGPIIAYGLVRGSRALGLATLGLYVVGWLAWTLLEYLLHRFVFHRPPQTIEDRVRSFAVHGYHHEFPNDRLRLVAPPLMSWPLAVVVMGLYIGLLGPTIGLTLFAGTASGYIAYDWIHYYTHHFKPRNPLGRWLTRYHLLHHYDESWNTHRFGVSSPLWDFVFGTYRPVRAAAPNQ